jgi:uncharacterized protein (DUF1919 family)
MVVKSLSSYKKRVGLWRQDLRERLFRNRVRNKNFTIISNNCWAALVYQELGRPYATPFIGLSIFAPCYLRLLADFQTYMKSPLTFTDTSRYEFVNEQRQKGTWSLSPIGVLGGDIEIHFLHYSSEAEAREKWTRRTNRINWQSDNLLFKFCDNPPQGGKGLWGDQYIVEFDRLDLSHKVCFTANYYPELKSAVWIREWQKHSHVLDGITLYRVCRRYFDLADWINGESGKIGIPQRLLETLLYF